MKNELRVQSMLDERNGICHEVQMCSGKVWFPLMRNGYPLRFKIKKMAYAAHRILVEANKL